MNQGPGGEEKVGYHKTSNFPSIGVFTVSPRPQELTNCLRGQAAPLPAPPVTAAALARLCPPLPARQWDPVYCLSICRQRGRPNRDVHFITSACSGTSGRFQRCSEMHHTDAQEMHRTDAQGPASPFAIVSFKDGEKEREIANSQDIFAFVLPSERDQEWGSACSCSLAPQAEERHREKLCLLVPTDPTAARMSQEECFTAEQKEKAKRRQVPDGAGAAAGR